MLHIAFSFLSLILLGDVVNCRVYVTFATDMYVLYKQEKLPFTCSPTGVAETGTITDIILWKNSTLGWKQIVKIWLKIENGVAVNEITWTDTDIENRAAIINQKVRPSSQTGLQIEISPINVKCSDKGEYKCSISGNTASVNFGSESTPKTVSMRVVPASINPIQVQPQLPDNTYNPYTSVRLTCNGDVGNPVSNLRWCIRTTGSNLMGDFTVYGNTNDITHGTPTLSGCQYRQQSVLIYNVSAIIPQADFRCETGGTSITCGHSSGIAANYTIYMYRFVPASINPIQVQPQQPGNIYNPYTSVRLTCNGDVGNPVSNLRWCIRTTGSNLMGDFIVYGNTNDITHGTPTLSGCQYRQQSVLTYNVSAIIPQADFRCETGGTSITCGQSSGIAANYTIYMYRFIQETSDVAMFKGVTGGLVQETSDVAMFKDVIGGLAGVIGILVVVIVVLLYITKSALSDRRHNTTSNRSK